MKKEIKRIVRMIDFDFDFDFDFDIDIDFDVEPVDINALVMKSQSKERKFFNISKEIGQLNSILPSLPNQNQVYKMLSVRGGFSSIGIIKYIAIKEPIEELYVSTFRIGIKQFDVLMDLKKRGLLKDAQFITSGMQGENGLRYDYLTPIIQGCKEYGWNICELNNHSKLILAKTKNAHYVIETSSNLNENPKIEQFSFENDKDLFEWYEKFFEAVLING